MGDITIRITGGTKCYHIEALGIPPTLDHSINWDVCYDPPFDFILEDINPGEYQVKVTDNNGCEEVNIGIIEITTTTTTIL